MIATATTVELLRFQPQSMRATEILDALTAVARQSGVELHAGDRYRGTAQWLVLWGPGGPDRFAAMERQLAAGGHVIAFDLAYWSRDRKVRVSIDAAHPQAWVMRQTRSAQRFADDPVPVADRWNPTGPVIIAGIGEKARVQYGPVVAEWERAMIAQCRARGCRMRYRRKTGRSPVPGNVALTTDAPIERVLADASLLVTWHSNVAVDAIRLGIPVVCCDGAARAVCADTLPADVWPRPLPVEIRDRFLHNLAWFQWAADEARECWAFLQELLCAS